MWCDCVWCGCGFIPDDCGIEVLYIHYTYFLVGMLMSNPGCSTCKVVCNSLRLLLLYLSRTCISSILALILLSDGILFKVGRSDSKNMRSSSSSAFVSTFSLLDRIWSNFSWTVFFVFLFFTLDTGVPVVSLSKFSFLNGSAAVSYTHLDVYKRQV